MIKTGNRVYRKMIECSADGISLCFHVPTWNCAGAFKSSHIFSKFYLHIFLILRLWQSHRISEGPVGHIRCDVIRLVRKRMQARDLLIRKRNLLDREFTRIFREFREGHRHLIVLRGDIFLAKHDRTPGRLFVAVRDPFGNDPFGRRLTGSIHGRCRRYGSSWDDRWC